MIMNVIKFATKRVSDIGVITLTYGVHEKCIKPFMKNKPLYKRISVGVTEAAIDGLISNAINNQIDEDIDDINELIVYVIKKRQGKVNDNE